MFRGLLEKRRAARDRKSKRPKSSDSGEESDHDVTNHVYEEIPDVITTALRSQFRLITPNMAAPGGTGKDCSPYMVVPIVDRLGTRHTDIGHRKTDICHRSATATGLADRCGKITTRNCTGISGHSDCHVDRLKAWETGHQKAGLRSRVPEKACDSSKNTRQSVVDNERDESYGFNESRMRDLGKLMAKLELDNSNRIPSVSDCRAMKGRASYCDNQDISSKSARQPRSSTRSFNGNDNNNDHHAEIAREYGKVRDISADVGAGDDWMDMDEIIYCANQNSYHTSLSSDVSMTSEQSSASSTSSKSTASSGGSSRVRISDQSFGSETSRTSKTENESKLSVRSTNDNRQTFRHRNQRLSSNNPVLSDLIRHNNDMQLLSFL